MVVFPGTAITVTILAANLFGDALRDFLDPKLR
jgi:peptide/nickel transport system permease protein